MIDKAVMLHFQSMIIEAIGNRNSICYVNSRDILYAQVSGNYINIYLIIWKDIVSSNSRLFKGITMNFSKNGVK